MVPSRHSGWLVRCVRATGNTQTGDFTQSVPDDPQPPAPTYPLACSGTSRSFDPGRYRHRAMWQDRCRFCAPPKTCSESDSTAPCMGSIEHACARLLRGWNRIDLPATWPALRLPTGRSESDDAGAPVARVSRPGVSNRSGPCGIEVTPVVRHIGAPWGAGAGSFAFRGGRVTYWPRGGPGGQDGKAGTPVASCSSPASRIWTGRELGPPVPEAYPFVHPDGWRPGGQSCDRASESTGGS